MFHIALTPDYSPSNALSAHNETLMGAIAKLLADIDLAYGPEEWYVQLVLVTVQEAVKNLEENKTAKASWTDMGCEDDAFSIDIFCEDDARYIRHDGQKWLAPHGAVGFVTDPLHEQWLYDQSEIGDWENVLLPKPYTSESDDQPENHLQTAIDALEDAIDDAKNGLVDESLARNALAAAYDFKQANPQAISTNQLRDVIANADHLELMVVRRQYAEIHTALVDDGFDVDLQTVMVVVDHLASSDPFFVQLAKDLVGTK